MTYQPRQIVNENGVRTEAIPLFRLDSTSENIRRENVRRIFVYYDRDSNGYLDVKEMKTLIRTHLCDDIPKGIASRIVEMADADNDGRLNFEEFYKLSVENDWLAKGYIGKYCKLIVPQRGISVDESAGTYESRMSLCPPPLTMIIFSIIEIAIYLYDEIYIQKNNSSTNLPKLPMISEGPLAEIFIYNPLLREQVWRFITYMFVHVGVMHLVLNLVIQIFLGTALELVHSWWRVSLVYISGVFAGAMGSSLLAPSMKLAGASGGVYALLTAHIATIILNWKEMEYASVQLIVVLLFCLVDLGQSIFNHVTVPNDQVGYIAHLFGAIAGLLVGIGVLRNLNEKRWERKLWWLAVSIYSILMLIGVFIHIFFSSHFEK